MKTIQIDRVTDLDSRYTVLQFGYGEDGRPEMAVTFVDSALAQRVAGTAKAMITMNATQQVAPKYAFGCARVDGKLDTVLFYGDTREAIRVVFQSGDAPLFSSTLIDMIDDDDVYPELSEFFTQAAVVSTSTTSCNGHTSAPGDVTSKVNGTIAATPSGGR